MAAARPALERAAAGLLHRRHVAGRPTVTLFLMDCFPSLRGATSSLQGFTQTLFSSLVAGVISPLLWGFPAYPGAGHVRVSGVRVWLLWRVRRGGCEPVDEQKTPAVAGAGQRGSPAQHGVSRRRGRRAGNPRRQLGTALLNKLLAQRAFVQLAHAGARQRIDKRMCSGTASARYGLLGKVAQMGAFLVGAGLSSGQSTTSASGRSPHLASGMAITAHSLTAGGG